MAYDIRGSHCDFQRNMGPHRENSRYHCFEGIIFFAELLGSDWLLTCTCSIQG